MCTGHKYAFGSTEEKYRVLTLGCKERGRQRDGPLNHATGKGWVKGVKGHYHDALYVKRSRVVVWLVEATGGVCPHACAHGRRLAERARAKAGGVGSYPTTTTTTTFPSPKAHNESRAGYGPHMRAWPMRATRVTLL